MALMWRQPRPRLDPGHPLPFLARTGVRVADACSARWEDVGLNAARAYIGGMRSEISDRRLVFPWGSDWGTPAWSMSVAASGGSLPSLEVACSVVSAGFSKDFLGQRSGCAVHFK